MAVFYKVRCRERERERERECESESVCVAVLYEMRCTVCVCMCARERVWRCFTRWNVKREISFVLRVCVCGGVLRGQV